MIQYLQQLIRVSIALIAVLLSCLALSAHADEVLYDLMVSDNIGYEDAIRVDVTAEVRKTRDVYVSVQRASDWKTVMRQARRVSHSGTQTFVLPLEDASAGRYRVNVFMVPKGKDWNARVAELQQMISVQDIPNAAPLFEGIQLVQWPEEIDGQQEATLGISYATQNVRLLVMKLINTGSNTELGDLSIEVNENGSLSLPFDNMSEDFGKGDYRWEIFLAETASGTPISHKYSAYFSID